MAFTTWDQVKAASATANRYSWNKGGSATSAFISSWKWAGEPTAAATPTSSLAGEIPTRLTIGAPQITQSGAGDLYLGRFHGASGGTTSLLWSFTLYDRLWQNSGLSPTTVGNQTINSIALDRPDVNGYYAEIWYQIYTVMGSWGGSATPPIVGYTNSAGTASKVATLQVYQSAAGADRTYPFAFSSGDTGCKSIQTFDNVVTNTSGNAGLVIRRRISRIGNENMMQINLNALELGLPRVYDNAALELLVTGVGAVPVLANIDLIEG